MNLFNKLIALSLFVSLQNPVVAVSMRDNLVKLWLGGKDLSPEVGFELIDYSITSGQPWGGIEQISSLTLNFRAGRHKSPEVVDWVKAKQMVPFVAKNAASNEGSGLPSELNFAALGLLRLKGGISGQVIECPNIILAQGSSWTSNNWWIFSNYQPETQSSSHSTLLQCYFTSSMQTVIYVKVWAYANNWFSLSFQL